MTRYLLFFLALFFCQTSSGQTYQYVPMPTTKASWKLSNTTYNSPGSVVIRLNQYDMTGKYTVVGIDTFYEIKERGIASSVDIAYYSKYAFEIPFTANSNEWQGWMIEKQKKVYVLNSPVLDTAVDVPTLDFGQAVGEKVFGGIYPQDTVVSIDTININGTLRKRIITKIPASNPVTIVLDTLIEGIGSTSFGVGRDPKVVLNFDYSDNPKLRCFSVNNQVEYQYYNAACENIWPMGVNNNQVKDEGPVISPNPFINSLQAETEKGSIIRIYNTIGRLVYVEHAVSDKKHSIPVSDWSPGLYLVVIEKDGNRTNFKLVKN